MRPVRLAFCCAIAAACTCDTKVHTQKFVCHSDDDCVGVPCISGVCGGLSTDGGPDDAGVDAGPPDAGDLDGGDDAGVDAGADAGPPDAGPPDAGPPDAGPPDAGPPDAGPRDAGPPDSGVPDAGPMPTQLAFTSAPFTVAAGACSPPLSVELRDATGTPRALAAAAQIALNAVPSATSFFADATCMTARSTVPLAAGATTATFHLRAVTGGPVAVTASLGGLTPATQLDTVLPVVRTGTCQLPAGASTVDCTIAPALGSLTRSMLVFQAPSAEPNPADSVLRCWLSATSTVSCGRSGTTGIARIVWQVAELQDAFVQQAAPMCNDMVAVTASVSSVTPTRTFTLFSHSGAGIALGINDISTCELTDSTTVTVSTGTNENCNVDWTGAVQVVELPGVSVVRGLLPGFTGPNATVGGLATASPSTTALLFSHRLAALSTGICDRFLRGELPNSTSLAVSRGWQDPDGGCTANGVEAVSWERVDFGARARVQQFTLAMVGGVATATATIAAVDTTRTVVLAAGQGACGQGMGEGAYQGDDVPGELCASFQLTSATQVLLMRESVVEAARFTGYAIELNP